VYADFGIGIGGALLLMARCKGGSFAKKLDFAKLRTVVVLLDVTGPLLPFSNHSECCTAARRRRHSWIVQHFVERNVGLRTKRAFAAGAPRAGSSTQCNLQIKNEVCVPAVWHD
jgi:hypothetical protein